MIKHRAGQGAPTIQNFDPSKKKRPNPIVTGQIVLLNGCTFLFFFSEIRDDTNFTISLQIDIS